MKKLRLLFIRLYQTNIYKRFFLLLIIIFFVSIFEILGAYLLSPIFNLISSKNIDVIVFHKYVMNFIGSDFTVAIMYSLFLFLLANIIKNILSISYLNAATVLRLNTTKLLRERIFKKVLLNYFCLKKPIKHNTGELNNIIMLETYNINTSIGSLFALLNASIISVMLLCYLLYLDFYSTLFISIAIFLILYLNRFFLSKVDYLSKKVSLQRNNLSGVFIEIVRNIKLVYTKNAINFETNRFKENNNLDEEITRKRDFYTNYTAPMTEIMAVIVMVVTIFIISLKSNNIGESIVFLYIIFRLMPYIKQINTYKVLLTSAIGAIDIILEYISDIDKQITNVNTINSDILKNKIEVIEISDLSFSYNGKDEILSNFNLEMKKGSIIEIIGESGSGKSTLFDVLLKIRDNYEGKISINKLDFKSISKSQWYSNIGYVPQEALLFDKSIAYNVSYPFEIDEKKVVACLKLASLNKFVDNVDYEVGENGSFLSGGQKQRVSIARALYTNPQVLFFDEATSALDKESEANILETIDGLPNDLIILIITHHELDIRYTQKINLSNNKKVLK